MRFYTTSRYANYVHVHMHLVGKAFLHSVKTNGLSDSQYLFRVSIDDNVAIWELKTSEKEIVKLFEQAKEANYNDVAVKKAVSEVARKLDCSFEITDMEELSREVHNIYFQHEKPKHTNESLDSPALRFMAK
ncbi:hypothetical protein IJ103_03040 [Candidatus Saccharibacteria bacterium]|nr:hypothetical protein [Candidatus Saccharibacteria bacterium]